MKMLLINMQYLSQKTLITNKKHIFIRYNLFRTSFFYSPESVSTIYRI